MQTALTAKRLWDGNRLLDNPLVLIEDGRIQWIGAREAREMPAAAWPEAARLEEGVRTAAKQPRDGWASERARETSACVRVRWSQDRMATSARAVGVPGWG